MVRVETVFNRARADTFTFGKTNIVLNFNRKTENTRRDGTRVGDSCRVIFYWSVKPKKKKIVEKKNPKPDREPFVVPESEKHAIVANEFLANKYNRGPTA